MSDTVTRTVASLAFAYKKAHRVPDGRGGFVESVIPFHALRGETIELSAEEAERGDALGVFANIKQHDEPATFDAATASVEELVAYLENEKPNAAETVALAGDDPEVAAKVLEAEGMFAGEREPRASVVKPLTAVVDAATSKE